LIDWNAILGEHSRAVWNTAYRLLGNDADASDCFQEVFADALVFSKKQHIKNFRALLLRLATCRALDILRQRHRKITPMSFEQMPDAEIQTSDTPVSAAENKELAEMLLNTFSKLEPVEAEIFCLKHLDNLSVSEIAQTVGLKENHIGVIIHRAKNKLKALLQNTQYNQDAD